MLVIEYGMTGSQKNKGNYDVDVVRSGVRRTTDLEERLLRVNAFSDI